MTNSRSITLVFPYAPPPALRKNSQGANRWAAKEARDVLQADAMTQLLDLPQGAYSDLTAIEVQYVSYYSGRPIDATEFATGMAPALDTLTPEKRVQRGSRWYVRPGVGFIKDDTPDLVRCLPTKYVRVKTRKEVKTLMIVTEIEETGWLWKETE